MLWVRNCFYICLLLSNIGLLAQTNAVDEFRFIENKGQWYPEALFLSPIPNGSITLQKNGILYYLYDVDKESELLRLQHDGEYEQDSIQAHRFFVSFVNPNDQVSLEGLHPHIEERNFLKGKDPNKWTQHVKAYENVYYHNIYKGIDFKMIEKDKKVKYEFIIHPGSKPKTIALDYEGVSSIYILNEQLIIQTALGNIIEEKPFAYQQIGDQRKKIDCKYVLEGNRLTYKLGKYNRSLPLIIDPRLIFSTSSGSLVDNWGNTACFDERGNLYTGGTVFLTSSGTFGTPNPTGFPTTFGAFQTSFQGGDTDMGVMKFDSSGNFLIYSTYIGGSDAEIPTSTVVNANNELYILGTTGSDDFPVTPGAYDTQFEGSTPEIIWEVNGIPVGTGSTFNSTTLSDSDQVRAVLNSAYSCATNKTTVSNVITMKQAPDPEVTIEASSSLICPGDIVNFTASVKNGTAPSYQWLLNNTPIGIDSIGFILATPSVGDTIQVIVTDVSCSFPSSTDTSNMIILQDGTGVLPAITIQSDHLPLCTGDDYTFSVSSGPIGTGYNYLWRVNGIAQGVGTTFIPPGPLANNDIIMLDVSPLAGLGCLAGTGTYSSNPLQVNNGSTVVPTVTIEPRPYSECDANITLVARGTHSGNNASYTFFVNGFSFNSTDSVITINRQYSDAFPITARQISNLGCAAPSIVFSAGFQSNAPSTTPSTISITSSTDTICSNENVSFTANTVNASSQNYIPVGGYQFRNGTDIVIIHLSADGSTILNSTYVGGRGNDGVIETHSALTNNYGDQLRGDINLDSLGNVYVSSTSNSNDFPTINAFQPIYGGGQSDAVVFKMNPNLSALIFSSYMGGTSADASFSVQINDASEVYIGGGTISSDFPTSGGALHPSPLGDVDGFVAHIDASGNTLINSSLVGTNQFDQVYFVQLDTNRNVYLLGQTKGNYPVQSVKYSNPNSGLFLHKLSPDLSTTEYSTVLGDLNSGDPIIPNISPTAFLVNECENIFISGWGGDVNQETIAFPGQIINIPVYNGGNTLNMPITPNAFQTTTDGSDFYLMVLLKDADSLIYSTYFGGATSAEHVDGGTSRFDFRGIVYQSVCSGCGGNQDFPTSPDDFNQATYPKRNESSNCNNGVFKFDLATLEAAFDHDEACEPNTIIFANNSLGGVDFTWDFGDGESAFTRLADTVRHTYEFPGTYTVVLIATDLTTCVGRDTATKVIVVPELFSADTFSLDLCEGDTPTLALTTNDPAFTYSWSPTTGLSNPTIFNPVFNGTMSEKYLITVTDTNGCVKVDTFDIEVRPILTASFISLDSCVFQKVTLVNTSQNGVSYTWDFGDGQILETTNADSDTLEHIYAAIGTYTINLTARNDSSCNKQDIATSITATIFDSVGVIGDTTICRFETAPIHIVTGVNPQWEAGQGIACLTCTSVNVQPLTTTTYYAEVTEGGCIGRDSVTVSIFPDSIPQAIILAEVPRCYSDTVKFESEIENNDCLCCEPISSWLWDFGDGTTSIEENPKHLYTSGNTFMVTLEIIARDTVNTSFPVTVFDTDSCLKNIYIPNAFTPNDDNTNDILFVRAINIIQLEFHLYNRWGEEVFETHNKNIGWDGIYKGTKMSPQVFSYTCKATFWDGEPFYQEGNVTLLE